MLFTFAITLTKCIASAADAVPGCSVKAMMRRMAKIKSRMEMYFLNKKTNSPQRVW